MATQKFAVGEIVECWRKDNNQSGWKVATIVNAHVDSRNRRAYRYTVDWQDNSDRLQDVQDKLIRKSTINFPPNPIEHADVPHQSGTADAPPESGE